MSVGEWLAGWVGGWVAVGVCAGLFVCVCAREESECVRVCVRVRVPDREGEGGVIGGVVLVGLIDLHSSVAFLLSSAPATLLPTRNSDTYAIDTSRSPRAQASVPDCIGNMYITYITYRVHKLFVFRVPEPHRY